MHKIVLAEPTLLRSEADTGPRWMKVKCWGRIINSCPRSNFWRINNLTLSIRQSTAVETARELGQREETNYNDQSQPRRHWSNTWIKEKAPTSSVVGWQTWHVTKTHSNLQQAGIFNILFTHNRGGLNVLASDKAGSYDQGYAPNPSSLLFAETAELQNNSHTFQRIK